jgi:hypothetical protein
VLVGTLVWMAIVDGVLKAVVLGGMAAIFIGPLFLFVLRSQHKEIAELRGLLMTLPAAANRG